MKKSLFLAVWLFLLMITVGLNAQPVVVVNEGFDNTGCSFSAPRGGWGVDSTLRVSGSRSYLGVVPTQPGDSVELISNWFDCQNYSNVMVQFSHICKVSECDLATVEFQIDQLGAKWQKFPLDAYKGLRTPYRQLKFHHKSYSEWLADDSLATPTNSWWKTEVYDLSADIAWERVRFKFKIKHGSVAGTQFANGWSIDDFIVYGANGQIALPEVAFIIQPADTAYTTGPFKVKAKVATRTMSRIIPPKVMVTYTYNNVKTYDSIPMTNVEGDSIWEAFIPQHPFGTEISYSITGRDTMKNEKTIAGTIVLKKFVSTGKLGYVVTGVGTGGGTYAFPTWKNYAYGWTKTIYSNYEMGGDGLITRIAYDVASGYTGPASYNQYVYFKAVNDSTITDYSYKDPLSDGATLVYQGTWDPSVAGWREIILDNPFVLPRGKHLMVIWINQDGTSASPYAAVGYQITQTVQAIYATSANGTGTAASTTAGLYKPYARFLKAGAGFQNSVSLVSIDRPTSSVIAGVSNPVKVTIRNEGSRNLTSCKINWSLNGTVQSAFSWTGNLPDNYLDTGIVIGSYVPRSGQYDNLVIWVSDPNGVADSATTDDTLAISTYGCDAPFSGKYIVGTGNGADFSTLRDALDKIALCGSNGGVHLLLQSGTYHSFTLTDLRSTMGNDTLYISSLAGDKDSVIFDGVGATAMFAFNNAHNVVVSDISFIRPSNGTVTYALQFQNGCENVEVRDCYIYMDTTVTSSAYAIYKTSSSVACKDIRIIHNEIIGGYYGVYFYGGNGTSNYSSDIVFDSNLVKGAYYYGYYFYYNHFKSFSHNTFRPRTAHNNNYMYNYIYYTNIDRMEGNRFDYYEFPGNYIYNYYYYINRYNTSNSGLFCNNEFIGNKNATGGYGMYLGYSNLDVYNNTFVTKGSYAIYLYNYNQGTANIQNNVFVNLATSGTIYPLYIPSNQVAQGVGTIDYNLYYSKNTVGYWIGSKTTLSAWQQATGQDAHSVYMKPVFYNLPDLDTLNAHAGLYDSAWNHALNLAIYNGLDCPVPAGVNKDINGVPRAGYTIMGCYAAMPVGLDAGISGVAGISASVVKGQKSTVKAILTNMGETTLTSANIGWSHNGVTRPGKVWTGSLATYASDTITLDTLSSYVMENRLKVWVSNPNNSTDVNVKNDTAIFDFNACDSLFHGTYVVGSSNADFATLEEAVSNLATCGVNGPVVLSIQKGIYDGFTLSDVPGLTSINNLTFTSATGNAEDVTILAKSGYAITLNSVKHVRFTHLTFDGTTGSGAVNMPGKSEDVWFDGCHMIATPTSGNYAFYHTGGACDSIFLLNNILEGGYYGLYFYGSGTGAGGYNTNIHVDSNLITGAFYYSHYFYYTDLTSFSHNKIKVTSNNNYHYCYFYYTNHHNTVANSWDFTESNVLYPYIYYYYPHRYNYGSSTDGYIVNNEVIMKNEAQGGYCMYLGYPGETQHIWHNSFYAPSTTGGYGIYADLTSGGSNANVELVNNLIWSNNYPIYTQGNVVPLTSDYNNLYNASGRLASLNGTTCTSLTAWATATGDNTSVSVQPQFLGTSIAGLELIGNTGMTCPAINSVSEDITGYTRNSTTTMGCYEYNPKSNDLYAVALLEPSENKVLVAGDTVSVKILVRNLGSNAATSFKVNWLHNNVTMTQKSWSGNLASMASDTVYVGYFTAVSGANRLKVWTSLPNNAADDRPSNDTVSVSVSGCDSLFQGTFTLGKGGDFEDIDDFVTTVGNCGLGGPITLKMLTGRYDCMMLDQAIAGTSATNTITITSAADNADSVIIYNSRGDDPTVVFGGGLSHVILEKVTIMGAGYYDASMTWSAVGFLGCDSVTVRKCKIICDAYEASWEEGSGFTNIDINNWTVYDFNELWMEDNYVTGVRYGFYLETNSNPGKVNIVRNDVHVRYVCMSGWGSDWKNISYNTFRFDIDTNARSQDYLYLAEMYSKNSQLDTFFFVGNRFLMYDAPVSYTYGYIEDFHPDSCFLFANNEFVYPKGSQNSTYVTYHDNMHFINNSVYMPTGGEFYLERMNSPIHLLNNNMVAGTGSFDWELNNRFLSSDYNNVYGMSLSDLQSMTGLDSHSVSFNPAFADVKNGLNMLDNSGLDCPMHPSVPKDINGKSRSSLTTIGCYEVEACGNNLMPRALVSPSNVAITGVNTPITVMVLNAGSNTVTSFNVDAVVNGVTLNQYKWSGTLASKASVNVTIGSFVPKADTNTFVIWTSQPNNGVDSLPSNDTLNAISIGCDSILSGDYVVTSNAELNNVITKLISCGVNAPVRVLLASGTYTTPKLQTGFMGVSHVNSVTFESQAGDADSVVWEGPLYLSDLQHVNFRNLTVKRKTDNYVVRLDSYCKDIEFYGCKILANPTTTTSSSEGGFAFYKTSGWAMDSLRLIKNLIDGGYYGLYIYGSGSNNMNREIIIDSNTIQNQYYYACYLYYNEAPSVSHNTILTRTTATNTYWYGLMMYYTNVPSCNGNRVHQRSSAITSPYLSYIYYAGRYGSQTRTNFYNNELMGYTTGTYYGLYMYLCDINVYNNTIRMSGSGASRGIYVGGTGMSSVLKNNVIVTMGASSTPIYQGTAGNSTSDYNCLYAPSYAAYSGAYMTFAAWKSTGNDVHSYNVSPVFTMSDSNAYLKLSSYNGLFVPVLPEVKVDRLGSVRAGMTIVGAYTQEQVKTDAALVEFVDWSNSSVIGNTVPVKVRLINMGNDNTNLTSANINWYVNGVKQTTYNWSGNLAPFADTVVSLGSFRPVAGNNVLAARVFNPNNGTDLEVSNDSISTETYGCDSLLHGVYTVATSGTPNFATMEDALKALSHCGVDGPTTFLIGAGKYSAMTVEAFNGASHSNMVTFASATGKASDVVISGTNHLTLNAAQHVRFENLTFGSGAGTRGISFNGKCKDVEFYHCEVLMSPTATSTTYAVYNYGTAVDSIRFIGNHFNGAYYGIYFYGSGTSVGGYNTNIVFDSNLVENAYYYTHYFYYTGFSSICHNTFLPRLSSTTYHYTYMYYCNLDRMEGNRYNFTRNANINYWYNYLYYINRYNNNGKRGLVCNNEVIHTRGNGYGWYLGYDNMDFINNSLLATSAPYPFYSYNDGSNDLYLKNNNIVCLAGDGMRFYNTSGSVTYESNNIYSPNGVMIDGTTYSTYADIVAATGDTNLTMVRPYYIDSTKSLEPADFVGLSCYRDDSVMFDITGTSRSIVTARGAYSLSVVEGKNLEMTQVLSPRLLGTVACYPDYSVAEVELSNKGTETIDFATDGVKVCMSSDSANIFYIDTVLSTGKLLPMQSMTVKLTDFFPTSYTGFYNIKAWVECAKDTNSFDDTASTIYEVTRVVLPFETDFTSIPLEFAFDSIQGSVYWELASDSILSVSSVTPDYGKSMLHFASSTGKASLSRAVIKQVDLQGSTKPKVSFWYAHDNQNPNSHDYVELLASTDGGETYTRLMTVYRYDASYTTPGWKMYQYDLSAYVNETCLHLAFEAGSYAGGDQNIDRIQIQVEQDVEVAELRLSDSLTACDLSGRGVSVVMSNSTLYDVNYDRPDSIYLHVSVMRPDSVLTTVKKAMSGRLLANTSDTVTVLTGYDFSMAGTYTFRAYVDTVTFTTDVTNDTLDYSFDVLPDLAVVSMDPIGNKSMGEVVVPTVYVVNSGNLTAEKVSLRMKVNDENDIVEVSNSPLKAGDTLKYTFVQGFTVPEIDPDQPYYFLSIESEMSCDMDATNDVYEFVGGVNLIDLSVYSIENPKASGFGCDSGRKEIYVNINLYNYSDVAVDTATVHVIVDSANTVYAEFTEKVANIAIGNTNMSLHTAYTVPNFNGTYKVKVFVENVTGEMNQSNDTAEIEACAIFNNVAVPDYNDGEWSLGQNIPNPARTSTVIPFSVPEDANVTLTLMSVSGQMLSSTVVSATAGENSYELNVDNLAAGIYYYTMEYKGHRLVKKMNVVK